MKRSTIKTLSEAELSAASGAHRRGCGEEYEFDYDYDEKRRYRRHRDCEGYGELKRGPVLVS